MCKYEISNFEWAGRIDSEEDKSAFRIHQVIKKIDIDSLDKQKRPFVVLLGFCSDEGVRRNKGRVGARKAPDIIRKFLSSIPYKWENLEILDGGNIVVDSDLEAGQKLLGEKVLKIKEAGSFPIVIGGGHEVAYGTFSGIKDYFPFIVNFDAHFDNRPFENGPSSGTMFAQIAEEMTEDYKYFCIGVQNQGNTNQLFIRNERFGGKYIFAEDVVFDNTKVNELVDELLNSDYVYTTVCMDVFSAAYAPGVSAPSPFGISPYDFLKYFNKIGKTGKLVAFDIAEVNPDFDIDNRTARLAAQIIFYVIENIYRWGYK